MRFSLRQMEVFRAVMLTGSIKAASQLLFTSQPAVSRIVSHTEQSLGVALFSRIKGKLVPTPEAEALFSEVDKCFQYAIRVDDFARNLAHGTTGTLNISSSPCLGGSVMARAITRFIEKHPKIRVDYHTTLLNDVAQEILSNKVDLAVCVLPPEHSNLTSQPFMKGCMVCVLPHGHELAQSKSIKMTDFSHYPLIAHHPSIQFGQMVSAAFRKAGVEPKVHVHIHQTEVACHLVQAGAGIAIVDQFTAQGIGNSELQIVPLEQDIPLTPSIVRSAFDTRKTHADKFIEVLMEDQLR